MNITELLIQPTAQTSVAGVGLPNAQDTASHHHKTPVHDDDLMVMWERVLHECGFRLRSITERNSLTDAILWPTGPQFYSSPFVAETPIHIKVIGRHMNGSFRCHIGTGKASRPIQSTELCRQMRLLAVFFRSENSKSQFVSPDFIFFPTWLLHLFRYTEHGSTPGRTDVRFLENAALAKEDHIYRLNNVLNTLFRFNLHSFDQGKLRAAVELANFLFDVAGLDHHNLPRPLLPGQPQSCPQPELYTTLLLLLHAPRPSKAKPMCHNCNTKTASRRQLCVACYRYQLKHGEPRPLRLIVANRPGPRVPGSPSTPDIPSPTEATPLPVVFYSPPKAPAQQSQKHCANCGVRETHQWYRNLCGKGHWCETCKSYYLRHAKVRPRELFIKAAKRKIDVRTLVNLAAWSWHDPSSTAHDVSRRSSSSSSSSSSVATPSPSTWSPDNAAWPASHSPSIVSQGSSCGNSPNPDASPTTPPAPQLSCLESPYAAYNTFYRLPPLATYPFDHNDTRHTKVVSKSIPLSPQYWLQD